MDKIIQIIIHKAPNSGDLYLYGLSENGNLYFKADNDINLQWTFLTFSPEFIPDKIEDDSK